MEPVKHDEAYEFSLDRSIDENLELIYRNQIREAVGFLTTTTDHDKGVHECRKRLKKIRALLRVLPRTNKTKNAEKVFKKQANLIGATRDAQSMVEAMLRLEDDLDGVVFENMKGKMEERRERIKAAENYSVISICNALENEHFHSANVRVHTKHFNVLSAQIQAIYQEGLDWLEICSMEGADAEDYHSLRKATKRCWYILCIFVNLWPQILYPLEKEWKQACDLLGHHHDFAVLLEIYQSHERSELFDTSQEAKMFEDIVYEKLCVLEKKILKTARLLYFSNAKSFAQMFEKAYETHKK